MTNAERDKICNAIVAVEVDRLSRSRKALREFVEGTVIGGLAGCDDDWPLDAKDDDELLELWEEYGYQTQYEQMMRRRTAGGAR
jgi:hypothetical protein